MSISDPVPVSSRSHFLATMLREVSNTGHRQACGTSCFPCIADVEMTGTPQTHCNAYIYSIHSFFHLPVSINCVLRTFCLSARVSPFSHVVTSFPFSPLPLRSVHSVKVCLSPVKREGYQTGRCGSGAVLSDI